MANQQLTTRKAYRQGELLFIPLSGRDLKNFNSGPHQSADRWQALDTNVIREGEATGHKHEVVTAAADAVTMFSPIQQLMAGLPQMGTLGIEDRFLVTEEPARITHPEHKQLRLPKGTYLIVVQREYDEVRARRVLD